MRKTNEVIYNHSTYLEVNPIGWVTHLYNKPKD